MTAVRAGDFVAEPTWQNVASVVSVSSDGKSAQVTFEQGGRTVAVSTEGLLSLGEKGREKWLAQESLETWKGKKAAQPSTSPPSAWKYVGVGAVVIGGGSILVWILSRLFSGGAKR